MGVGVDHQQEEALVVPGKLIRKLLAVAVRSIQWSYGIFWSKSLTQLGVLEWGDGYYNGGIKTRKMLFQSAEDVKPGKMGLERSKQLRELYMALLEGENSDDEQAPRPNTMSLAPEDLSDSEWFYMVCMSFIFNPSQGLPGRALANDRTIWLSNAQYADGKVFVRSLLAKSASIQTVLCFPYLGGVMELGTTELVPEDSALIQHVKTTLLDFSKPDCYVKYTVDSHSTDNDEEPTCATTGQDDGMTRPLHKVHGAAENLIIDEEMRLDGPSVDSDEDSGMGSPDDCSYSSEQNHQSHVHSWHFTDGDFGTDVHGSMNSSDCVSQVLDRPADKIRNPRVGIPNNLILNHEQSGNKLRAQDSGICDDLHYKRTVSAILKSNPLTGSLDDCGCHPKSSFFTWKYSGVVMNCKSLGKQSALKKMLFTVPLMYSRCLINPKMEDFEDSFTGKSHNSMPEKLENDKFTVLRSMIPSIALDKASVLNDTIKYVEELEARREELESGIDISGELKREAGKQHLDTRVEQTSDNCGRKTLLVKRKACDTDIMNSIDILIEDQEVFIEISCAWREYLLLDIMDAINRLHLDAHSVHSSTQDGILTLKVKSKFRGSTAATAGVLKQAIWDSMVH